MLYSAVGRPFRGRISDAQPAATAAHQSQERRVNVLDEIVQDQLRTDLPVLASGDTVKVSAQASSRAIASGSRCSRGPSCACAAAASPARSRSAGSPAASGSSGRSRSTARASTRSRSCATGVARRAQLYFLRNRVGKAATLRERRDQLVAGHSAAPPGRGATSTPSVASTSRRACPVDDARIGTRRLPARSPCRCATDGRHRSDPPPRAPLLERRPRCASWVSTRSASRPPAARLSRRR